MAKFVNKTPALTFDDVLVVPSYSTILPSQANVSTQLTRSCSLNIPLLSSAMDTVTESRMAAAMANSGGIGIIHKNMKIQDQACAVRATKYTPISSTTAVLDDDGRLVCGAAIGTGDDSMDRAVALIEAGVNVLVIDTAHGHSIGVGRMVEMVKKQWPRVQVVAGNICTGDATDFLIGCGADAVKVGVGPGTICSTRTVAGVGVPQFTAIVDCANVAAGHGIPVIADGGIRTSGDIVKALAAGASSVMIGSLFAGSDEAPGDIVTNGGRKLKTYRGMGSVEAMQVGSKDRYGQAEVSDSKKLVAEGVSGFVECTGPVDAIIDQLVGGIRSGMGYTGSNTIQDLWESLFIRITPAGIVESRVHDVITTKD